MSTSSQTSSALNSNTDRRLSGKVAVVTGASSGLGEATARELAKLGVSVVLAARDKDKWGKILKDIEATGGAACMAVVDVSKATDIQRMVDTAVERYGRLDFAVNNAGRPGRGPFLEAKLDEFDNVMATNVSSVFLSMQAEIPAMLKSGVGPSWTLPAWAVWSAFQISPCTPQAKPR